VFCLGGVLHLILDSVVGEVQWLAPFSDRLPFRIHGATRMLAWSMPSGFGAMRRIFPRSSWEFPAVARESRPASSA
jgi:hypothetical protein